MQNNQAKSNRLKGICSQAEPVIYEIIVQGQLDPQRSKWFEGMTLAYTENGESGLPSTLITGPVIDQPALHGLLTKIRDLNLTLISVRRSVPGRSRVEEVAGKPGSFDGREDSA